MSRVYFAGKVAVGGVNGKLPALHQAALRPKGMCALACAALSSDTCQSFEPASM